MARQARKKSETGIYHIMLRGVNKQIIFLEDEDYRMFIRYLGICKTISDFEIYAYCLMDNHIHLLIQENDEPIATVMKRITCRFVYWYNTKYDRVGHLFQDRFRSEPVETDEYLFSVIRYIHQNPVKANIVDDCSAYEYSSYNWYFKKSKLINSKRIYSFINKNQFKELHNTLEEAEMLDMEEKRKRLTDKEANNIFSSITGCSNIDDFKKVEKLLQKEYVQQLKTEGCSIKQICDLSGLTYGRVSRW